MLGERYIRDFMLASAERHDTMKTVKSTIVPFPELVA